jgi:lipopolysaccharide export system permease protein
MPMFVLLALLFSVSMLSRKNEILAMKASGISLQRIVLPFLVVTTLIAAGHFYYNEFIFPPANKKRLEIKEFVIERRSRSNTERVTNVYRQIHPGYFYTVSAFNIARKEGADFKLYKTDDNKLNRIVTAEKLVYDEYLWKAVNGVERDFAEGGVSKFVEFDTLIIGDIQDVPEDFAKWIGKPEDMGYNELKGYIDLMKRIGGPYAREAVDLDFKVSYPLASVIVVLICVPFATMSKRGSIAYSFAAGALISLVYFILFKLLQSAGYNEKIPKEVAVWGVNGLFFVIGLFTLYKARK